LAVSEGACCCPPAPAVDLLLQPLHLAHAFGFKMNRGLCVCTHMCVLCVCEFVCDCVSVCARQLQLQLPLQLNRPHGGVLLQPAPSKGRTVPQEGTGALDVSHIVCVAQPAVAAELLGGIAAARLDGARLRTPQCVGGSGVGEEAG
jgi:hypothetical protein